MNTIRRLALAVAVFLIATSALAQQAFNEDYFTTADGVKIHYLTAGTTGSWVVLIHGYSDNTERMWFRTGIAPALAKTAISSNGAPPLYMESITRFIDAYDKR